MKFTTYEQDLKELGCTEQEYDNVISCIYDKTNYELIEMSKKIKAGTKVEPIVKKAFERVLCMRQAERQEAFNFYFKDYIQEEKKEQQKNPIDKAIENRQQTYHGMYSDIGTVLDKFTTSELAEYYIKRFGDGGLRYYIEQQIIAAEISKNKIKIGECISRKPINKHTR